jgi:hypothetical protein
MSNATTGTCAEVSDVFALLLMACLVTAALAIPACDAFSIALNAF